jgi:hypothetical protein
MLMTTLQVSTISLLNVSPKHQGFDYYLTLSYGLWKISTTLNPEKSRDLCWKYPSSAITMKFDVTIDELIAQKFHIQVWDSNGSELQASGQCTLESSLKTVTNNLICASIFLVDKELNEFGLVNVLIQVIKSGFLTNHGNQHHTTPPSSPSRLSFQPTISIPKESETIPQQPQSLKENQHTIKAAVTKVNPDGTCTIRFEDGRHDEIQFVTGIFQISSQFKPGESVEISYPGSISHFFPGVISRSHPDGTFIVKYQNGTREMRLGPTNIKKLEPQTHSLQENLPRMITEMEVEKGCEAIEELKQRIHQQNEQCSHSISQQLETTKQIFKKFHEHLTIPSPTGNSATVPSLTALVLEQQQTLRNERFSHLTNSESIRRTSLEKRIESMKRFSLSSSSASYQRQQQHSHHLHLHHYPALLFGPFHKEILKQYQIKKIRRQASFVIKRFFHRVIAWVKVVIAVKHLTKNRLRWKKINRREKAALVIQNCLKRKLFYNSLQKKKFCGLIILKALKKRRAFLLRKSELRDQFHFLKLILNLQRIYRWKRNQKWEKIRKMNLKQDLASRKIQNLFRKRLVGILP